MPNQYALRWYTHRYYNISFDTASHDLGCEHLALCQCSQKSARLNSEAIGKNWRHQTGKDLGNYGLCLYSCRFALHMGFSLKSLSCRIHEYPMLRIMCIVAFFIEDVTYSEDGYDGIKANKYNTFSTIRLFYFQYFGNAVLVFCYCWWIRYSTLWFIPTEAKSSKVFHTIFQNYQSFRWIQSFADL